MTSSENRTQDRAPEPSDLVLWDACALQKAIHARQVSCHEVMEAYLDHIERLNPRVNAIVSLRERSTLLAEAAAEDEQLARGDPVGPLHGFPQAIKDLAATKGLRTTQGSPLFAETVPQADAIFVERMRKAGAVIIGKTNTPEFGLGSQTHNPVFGPTRNAYDPARTSGGSSGGAAVALALRMLPVADGSDHAGSLRNPAAFNNVLGLRTTFGRVPQSAEEIFLPQLGVAGPMARKAADLALLLSVQSGYDPRTPLALREDPSILSRSLAGGIAGRKIGWIGDWGGYLPMEEGVLDLCRDALRVFEGLGCTVEEVRPAFDPERIWNAWRVLRAWQVGFSLSAHYADPEKRVLLKPEAQWEVEQGLPLSAFDVLAASQVRSAWYHVVRALFEEYDYLVLPSAQVFPFDVGTLWPSEIAGRTMDTYHRWMEVVIPVTMSGCPAINLPVGFDPRGLPMGMQVVGPYAGEFSLLRLAQAYEDATRWVDRVVPPMLREAALPRS